MGTPEVPREVLDRLTHVEDAVQEIRFVYMSKTDAQTAGLGILHAQQQRLQQEMSGFRAEVAAHLGSVDTRLESLETEQARQGQKLDQVQTTLAEVLRRLPEPGSS
jgi:hypothetical protein